MNTFRKVLCCRSCKQGKLYTILENGRKKFDKELDVTELLSTVRTHKICIKKKFLTKGKQVLKKLQNSRPNIIRLDEVVPDNESEISKGSLGDESSSDPESEETDRRRKKSKNDSQKRRKPSGNFNFADSRSLSIPRRKRINSMLNYEPEVADSQADQNM